MSCPKISGKKKIAGWQELPFCIDCDSCITNDIRLLDNAVISFILPAKLANFSKACKFPHHFAKILQKLNAVTKKSPKPAGTA